MTSCCVVRYKFTGKERDSETGLDYFGARYYGSNMGRWMSPDWSAAPSPIPYADLTDPQSLNLYGYVRSNPLAKIDHDGHLGCGFLFLGKCPSPSPPNTSARGISTSQMVRLSATERKLSPKGLQFIMSYEKFRATPYKPTPNDKPTIGYGHVIKPGEKFDKPLTQEQAVDLANKDAQTYEKSVNNALSWSCSVWIHKQPN